MDQHFIIFFSFCCFPNATSEPGEMSVLTLQVFYSLLGSFLCQFSSSEYFQARIQVSMINIHQSVNNINERKTVSREFFIKKFQYKETKLRQHLYPKPRHLPKDILNFKINIIHMFSKRRLSAFQISAPELYQSTERFHSRHLFFFFS